MGFTVTPQQSGTLYIQVRTTMKKSHGSPCDYVNDVSGSGGTIATDHQGWTVRQYTVTVQGGSFVHDSKSTADTSVSMEFPTARNGASNVMYVQYESGSSQQDSLVRFDLGSIPPGSDVTSAEIELHRQNSWDVNGAITLFAAQSTWSEGSLDWNNHPGYVLPSVESVPGVTGTILTWNSTNLVDLVQEWIDGATANNGLIIGGSQSGQFFVLHTKEQSGTSLDPSIHVEYSPPVCTTSYYLDADLDGYGDPGDVAIACSAPMGYVANNQDCDDSDSEQYPGSSEICNGEDDDCDLSVDEGSSLCDDAEFCNGIEVCSSGVCQPGTPPVCDDSLFCNGTETCNSGSCQAGTPPVCDDGLFCNGSESCDDQVGCQVGQPPVCDDGVFCNGPESCDDGLGCMDGPPPCPGADGDADCAESCDEGANTCIAFDPVGSACTDDGDEFTKDWCDGSGVCTHIPCSSGGPPAASKIAFAGKQAGNVEIYVVNADGSSCSPTNITNDPAHDGDPTWSPDGLQIAFASRRTGNHDIFVVNSDGTGGPPVNVSNDPGLDLMPSWSPNGGQIAFISERDGSPNVYVVNSDGSSSSPTNVSNTIGEPEVSFRPVAWSPNGDQIAFTAERTVGSIWNFEIYVVNSDGSSIAPINITDDPAQDINPAWSPDGGQIAFSSGMGEDTDIFVVNADGSGGSPTRITATASNIYTNFPSWSPDGTRIAFAAEIEDQAGDNDEIYVVNSDGSSIAPINITDDPAFDVDISWSPDSSQIAFSSERASVGINEFSEVFVVNADGNSATRLTNVVAFNTSSNWGPVWSPDLVPAPPVPALAAGRIFALVLFMIGIAVAAVADRKFKLRFPWVR
jgi:TolB protein